MIESKIEKYLNEANKSDKMVSDFVHGIKGWLDTFEQMYNYGNIKGAKNMINDIYNEVVKMKKRI
jgi:soluble cytochrome b562